jgi:hypothetical protein
MERRNVSIHYLIVAFAGNDVANATPWTCYVAIVSGNEVDVGVQYRLTCCFPAVHSDVKSLWLKFSLKYAFDLSDEIEGIYVFLICHLPERYNMALWNYESMAARNREVIWKRKRQLGLSQYGMI